MKHAMKVRFVFLAIVVALSSCAKPYAQTETPVKSALGLSNGRETQFAVGSPLGTFTRAPEYRH